MLWSQKVGNITMCMFFKMFVFSFMLVVVLLLVLHRIFMLFSVILVHLKYREAHEADF